MFLFPSSKKYPLIFYPIWFNFQFLLAVFWICRSSNFIGKICCSSNFVWTFVLVGYWFLHYHTCQNCSFSCFFFLLVILVRFFRFTIGLCSLADEIGLCRFWGCNISAHQVFDEFTKRHMLVILKGIRIWPALEREGIIDLYDCDSWVFPDGIHRNNNSLVIWSM